MNKLFDAAYLWLNRVLIGAWAAIMFQMIAQHGYVWAGFAAMFLFLDICTEVKESSSRSRKQNRPTGA